MLVCRDVAHTIGIRILWGKCTTSAECKTIRIAVPAVMDVGMEAARPKGKEFCFIKEMFYPSGTGGNVPGRYGRKMQEYFGHMKMTGEEKWVILTYGSFSKRVLFTKTLFQQIYRDVLSTGNHCFRRGKP